MYLLGAMPHLTIITLIFVALSRSRRQVANAR
jgi:hypothetical protein